jgi:hypothetical protein
LPPNSGTSAARVGRRSDVRAAVDPPTIDPHFSRFPEDKQPPIGDIAQEYSRGNQDDDWPNTGQQLQLRQIAAK